MPAADLQTFVNELERRRLLRRIPVEVDPELEITEIADRVTKAGGPALLFERVKGHDMPVLINTFGTRERMCLALGVESFEEMAARAQALIKPEIPTTLMEKIKKLPELAKLGSLPPRIVKRGVCQEVVRIDDADVTRLPALKCWPLDGDLSRNTPSELQSRTELHEPTRGRYITFAGVYTKDPDSGERNIGMYRVQVFGPKLCAMHWHMHHDGARHWRKYQRRGECMPLAAVLGGPAVMPYAATCPLPPDLDEAMFAGFLNQGAIDLVPCVTQPRIEVPATAEIVVEGYLDPEDPPIVEGPFGDHTGFYSTADLYPRFHVTAVTHRYKPVFPATVVGKPPQEDYWLGKATERIFLPMLQMIIPDIIDYNLPMFGCFHNCAFVKIRKEYPYQARRVMHAIWGAGQMAFTKMIVVVDEHVDVQDEQAVLFHMCANVDPRRDIVITEGPLDILDHAAAETGVGGKIGIDATRKIPGEGTIRDWPDEIEMTAEVRERVTRRWAEYGLEKSG
ncbi:MAG: UbiD family decarboxylase [Planctomycetota bacterium]|nr:MAG: UbiD family decarboxylase [Planctomycetota bacterium]